MDDVNIWCRVGSDFVDTEDANVWNLMHYRMQWLRIRNEIYFWHWDWGQICPQTCLKRSLNTIVYNLLFSLSSSSDVFSLSLPDWASETKHTLQTDTPSCHEHLSKCLAVLCFYGKHLIKKTARHHQNLSDMSVGMTEVKIIKFNCNLYLIYIFIIMSEIWVLIIWIVTLNM